MKKNRFVLAAVVTLIGAFGACAPAFATVSFTNSFTTFQSLSITSLEATFEGILTEGIISNPYTEGRVTFTNPSNLYNARPGGPAAVFDFDAPVTSNVLTVSGNEDITMTFSGPAPTAVGFTSLTNRFDAPTVSVFDLSNSLIGSYVLTQSPGTVGFVGITSSVGIGSVRWLAVLGGVRDTAIDNVYVGVAVVPAPSSYALMVGGLLALLGIARRRKTT